MRCQIHVCSSLLELFVHDGHKAFLEVVIPTSWTVLHPILGVCAGGLVIGEEVEVALVDFDMDVFWVFLNLLLFYGHPVRI